MMFFTFTWHSRSSESIRESLECDIWDGGEGDFYTILQNIKILSTSIKPPSDIAYIDGTRVLKQNEYGFIHCIYKHPTTHRLLCSKCAAP
jgi:hypothetical protein